jgi:flavin reductase (DIM6/NTAB) family NADH-FMN oxidoreductase RutF
MGKQYWKPGNMLYPVPAVMVSCQRKGEKPNIITVAWAGTICSSPAMLSISVRKSRYSYDIIKETGEFVVNLVTKDLVFATDYCGVKSGKDVDKFKEMKLTPLPSREIHAPGISESPVNLECRVTEIKELGSHDLFLAEIVSVTVDDRHMDENGKFQLNKLGLTAYSHGEYFELGEKLGSFGYSVRKKPVGKKAGKSSERYSGKKSEKIGTIPVKSYEKPTEKSKDKKIGKPEKTIDKKIRGNRRKKS